MAFHDPLRQALHNYPIGVHSPGAPASAADLSVPAQRLGAPLPQDYADFLRSWNGVSLFQDLILVFSTSDPDLTSPAPGRLRIGQTPDGALWMDAAGVVRLVDEAGPDPLVSGTTLSRWFAATLAREALLLDRQGEFREVFDEEGALLGPVRKRRVQAGRKHDPGASLYLVEEAEMLLEGHQFPQAQALLLQAVEVDPGAGAALELLAALYRDAGKQAEAETASLRAAAASVAPALRGSRLLDAAQAGPPERAAKHAAAAWAADPGHALLLINQAQELLSEGDRDEAAHLQERLLLLLSHVPAGEPAADIGHLREQAGELERDLRTREALRVV